MGWNLQQINGSGPTVPGEYIATNGPSATGFPFVSVYGDQQHFTYIDANYNIQDAWWDGARNQWNLQQLTQGPPSIAGEWIIPTPGPQAYGPIFVSVYNNQQHFVYRDQNNSLQDAWWDGDGNQWNLQQLTQGPASVAGEYIIPAAGPQPGGSLDLFVSVYNNQQHFTYVDHNNSIQDAWWDGEWHLQQLTQGPASIPGEWIIPTPGPPEGGGLFVSVYNNQQHFAYIDQNGNIQDAWWDGAWHLQQLTQGPASVPGEWIIPTPGPQALGPIFVSVYNNQQHFAYFDQNYNLQDVWWDGNQWNLQQLTQDGVPGEWIIPNPGPPGGFGLFVSVYNNQQHFAYLAAYIDGHFSVQDVWWDGNQWNLQQLTQGPAIAAGEWIIPPPGPQVASATSGLFVSVYNNQQHFAYVDLNGNIQDAWWDGG